MQQRDYKNIGGDFYLAFAELFSGRDEVNEFRGVLRGRM
jgi:hypothetical protein